MSAPPIPYVLHARAEPHRQSDGDWRMMHPCGAPRGATHEPHPTGVDPRSGCIVRSAPPNCPGCVGFFERHAALCTVVRR